VACTVLAGCGGSDPTPSATSPSPTIAPATSHEHAHTHTGEARLLESTRADDGWYEHLYVISNEPTVEVSEYPLDAEATAAQRTAADELRRAVAEGIEAWPDLDAAVADGFEEYAHLGPSHLVSIEHVEDGRTLDPTRPEFLLVDHDGVVWGAMFLAADNDARGPQVGGPLTLWHYHRYPTEVCWRSGGLLPAVDPFSDQSECPEGALFSDRSPEMLHVWVLDHPDGPFSSNMGVFTTDGSASGEPAPSSVGS
jgi:hypothetical protein